MVSFGVAPALVVYRLGAAGFLGGIKASPCSGRGLPPSSAGLPPFVYCACAALRLARFNTTLDVADKRFFQGLPSPAAATLLAGLVWAIERV
jgi:CDP-diacylglycerol---serine O-phosphatidyltransferase